MMVVGQVTFFVNFDTLPQPQNLLQILLNILLHLAYIL